MTTPTLSPDELIRSRAFFDAAAFNEIAEHADDVIPCFNDGCVVSAVWRFSIRCCDGDPVLMCPGHANRTRVECLTRIARAQITRRPIFCKFCDHTFPATAQYEDIIQERQL